METDPVKFLLDEECGRAHAVALTQASEFGSTQRIAERCATAGLAVFQDGEQTCNTCSRAGLHEARVSIVNISV